VSSWTSLTDGPSCIFLASTTAENFGIKITDIEYIPEVCKMLSLSVRPYDVCNECIQAKRLYTT